MIIHIDSEYCCHTSDTDGVFRTVEHPFFDGKCDVFVEGYRFVPAGEIWTREDGVVFTGEMIAPWKSFKELDAAQRRHEREQLADMKAALELLGVTLDE